MTEMESFLIWTSVFLYVFSIVFCLSALILQSRKRFAVISDALLWVGFGCETIAILVRWYTTGHLPTVGLYEDALASTWVILLFTIVLSLRRKIFRHISLVTAIFSVIFLGVGIMSNPSLKPLSAAFMSNWLLVHVVFSWIGFAAYAVALGMGIIYILKNRAPSGSKISSMLVLFPDLDLLDDMMFKYIVFGFVNHLLSITSGSIWAKDLWGSYWSWDPVEMWSLTTWLLYGLIIHLKISLRWSAERLAYLSILGICGAIISWVGINLVVEKSLHMFSVN